MQSEMDPDVQSIAEFMLAHIPAARLVGVVAGLSAVAPILWGHYPAEDVRSLRVLADDLHTPLTARCANRLSIGRVWLKAEDDGGDLMTCGDE